MNKIKSITVAMILYIVVTSVIAKPVETTLQDYAYNFPSIGYEISFIAGTYYFSDPMTPNDYFKVRSGGYSLKARADKLSRNNTKLFIQYYNNNCKGGFTTKDCIVRIYGEVALDEDFKMIIWAKKIDFLDRNYKVIKTFE